MLFGYMNGFGVTATFNVKDAVIVPAMLVIPNQAAVRIGRQGGFTRT